MSLKEFLNIDIEKMKENNKKRELDELEPIPEAIKEEIKLKKAIEKRREKYKSKKTKKITDKEKKQLIKEEMEAGIKLVLEELDDTEIEDDEEKIEEVLIELGDKKLDEINLQDAIEEKELMEQYKLETGKDAITLKGTIRKHYIKFKEKMEINGKTNNK